MGCPTVNHEEVEDWKFINIKSLRNDLDQHPDRYTVWFRLIMNHAELKDSLKKSFQQNLKYCYARYRPLLVQTRSSFTRQCSALLRIKGK